MLSPVQPYHKELDASLVLKSVVDARDVERLAAFNGSIHDDSVAAMTHELIHHHPHTRPEGWLFVEDQATGQIISSLCLIPWTWRYEGVALQVGEMGIVGTREDYRHRGLVRALAARFDELLRQGDFDLSPIQGIPFFYRQLGYEYALPLEADWRLELYQSPDPPPGYSFRQATLDDLPALMAMYDQAAADLSIHAARDEAVWRYLFGPSLKTEVTAQTWLVLDETKRRVGYYRVPEHGFGEGLIVNEVSRLSHDAALAVLDHLKRLAVGRRKPYLRLNLPVDGTLVQVARCHGARHIGTYAWQIRLVDVGRLLGKLAPVLERRIAASPFAGLTEQVCLNLYREAFEMRFERGRLVAVESLGFKGRSGIDLPPALAAPLLLGYRSRQELAQVYPDVMVWPEWSCLVDVLFPKVSSFIYTNY
ncbi:MAG: GNAT family N-acetyltransferase [Chloroflexota bacterium]